MSSDTSETDFLIPSPTISDEEEVDLFSSFVVEDDEEDSILNFIMSQLSMVHSSGTDASWGPIRDLDLYVDENIKYNL